MEGREREDAPSSRMTLCIPLIIPPFNSPACASNFNLPHITCKAAAASQQCDNKTRILCWVHTGDIDIYQTRHQTPHPTTHLSKGATHVLAVAPVNSRVRAVRARKGEGCQL